MLAGEKKTIANKEIMFMPDLGRLHMLKACHGIPHPTKLAQLSVVDRC